MGKIKKSREVQVIPHDLSSSMIARLTDLTELKDIAEALRKSEERFRSFFEKARDPILLIDDSFHFIDCNIAAVIILGAGSRDEILDKPPAYFSPEYQPDGQLSVIKAEQMIKNAYKKGSLQFEWIHKRMDGVAIYMDVSLTVITMGSKKVLLVHWRDITDSKKAEETIRKLYQAIEQTNEIVFMTDVDGTINFVNTAFENVYGYKKEEVVGKVTPRILKSGVMNKTFYKDLWKKLPAGKGLRKEIINKTKDGRLITVHTSLTPIFNDMQILIGYMAVQEDITEKKIAEKKLLDAELQYRTLFKQSPDGICVIDYKTLLPLEFNEKIHNQLGYSREGFSQLKISDYEIIDTPDVIKARAKKIMHEGKDNFLSRHKTKNGDIRDVQITIQKIFLQGNPVLYAIFRDVTDKMKLEKALRQQEIDQQRQIIEATISGQEKEKNELGKELHDNINQLLATVKMYLGMVKAKQDAPINIDLLGKSYDYVNMAIEEIRKLTHSLVAPTLGDAGLQQTLKEFIKEVNLTHGFQVRLVIEMNKRQIIDKKKELMIYRIVQEQINNINKHAKAKTINIHLKAKDAHLNLSIADDGIGFDTTKKDNGIGLKNIQSRVEFYSGNMNIISSPGKGCTLEITIPL
ncbi:MAG: PAS domain-containing sensor histidine kinase [Bacteroidia bacterium]